MPKACLAPAAILLTLLLAACQVTPPDTPAAMARATGIDNAITFQTSPDPLNTTVPEGTLTRDAAIRLALAHDPRLQVALAQVRQSEADANQARLLPNPILNIDLRVPHEPGSNTAFEATLTGDLVSLLQKPAQISAADQRLRAASQDAVSTALDVMQEVQETYIAVQADEAQLQSARQRTELLKQQRDLAQKRINAGEGVRLDVLIFDAQLASATLDELDLQRQRMEDRLTLARLLGQPRAPADWPVEPWSAPAGAPAEESAWITAALQSRPEIQSKLLELKALGDDLTAAEFSPFVGGDAGVHTERDPEWRTGTTITIPLPIFDFGQAARQKIQAQRLAARHELAALHAQIIQEVRIACATDAFARQALAYAQQTLFPLQQQQVDLARKAYQSGDTDLTLLLLAQAAAQETAVKIVDLQQKAALARIKLQHAAGGAAVAQKLESAPATTPAPAATAPTGTNP